jgi:septum site-determining protein MinC
MAAVAPAPAVFDLRSASLSLVAMVLKTPDLAVLAEEMAERLAATPDVFNHDPVVVDLSQLPESDDPIDFDALAELLKRHRMLPVGVRGGSPAQAQAALAAGLAETPEAPAAAPRQARVEPVVQQVIREVRVEVPVEVPGPATPTLIIDKPLRSGQQVYAKGGDLVLLAAVNFGAEVIADGNVHVYAPLRGKAIAGARGKADARIFSTCMEPELVAIAGTYRTTDTPLSADVLGKPAQIRLEGDRLVFEPLN